MIISIENLDIYIISLDISIDRQKKIQSRLDRFNLKYKFFKAYKHTDNIFDLNIICNVEGCATSHIMLIKQLYENKKKQKKHVLILEDDALFCDDFLEAFKYISENFQNKDFDILFLSSYYHIKKNFPEEWHKSFYKDYPIYINSPYFLNKKMNTYFLTSDKNINFAPGSFTLTAYIVNMKNIDKIYNTLLSNIYSYDPRLILKNPAIDMLFILLGYYKYLEIYSVSPGIICQEDGFSYNSNCHINQSIFFREDICGPHVFQKNFFEFDFYEYFKDNCFDYDVMTLIHTNTIISFDCVCNKNLYYYFNLKDLKENETNSRNVTKTNGKYIIKNWGEYYIYDLIILLNINKNRIIIDIGTNNGFFSIPIIKDGYFTIMIEPIPSNIFAIEKTIEINNIPASKYILNKCAVSSNNYSTNIYTPVNFTDNTSLNINAATANVKSELEYYYIYCKKLDNIIIENNFQYKDISFIKIDVQGFELPVIIGSLNLLIYSENLYIYLEKDIEMTIKAGFNYYDIETILEILGFSKIINNITEYHSADILFYKNKKKNLSTEDYKKIIEIKNNTEKTINKHKLNFLNPSAYSGNIGNEFLYQGDFKKYCDNYIYSIHKPDELDKPNLNNLSDLKNHKPDELDKTNLNNLSDLKNDKPINISSLTHIKNDTSNKNILKKFRR